jgi:hypothetical protein
MDIQIASEHGRFPQRPAQPTYAQNILPQVAVAVAPTRQPGDKTINEQLAPFPHLNGESDSAVRLQAIVNGLHAAGWPQVVLVLWDETGQIRAQFSAGQLLTLDAPSAATWQSWLADSDFQALRQGNCYFIPGDSRWSEQNPSEPTTIGRKVKELPATHMIYW